MSAFSISDAAARAGLPESTLRYWERIGLMAPVTREESSGHRRYSEREVSTLETLANLRAVGMSIQDMRDYLVRVPSGDEAAGEQRELFQTHANRLRNEIATLQTQLTYLEVKVAYWSARELGDLDRAAAIAEELGPLIRQVNPKGYVS